MEIKLGAMKDGRIVAAQAILKVPGRRLPGSPVNQGAMCAFASYDLPNVDVIGFDVLSNRPKTAAYRAPGSPIAAYGSRAAWMSWPTS